MIYSKVYQSFGNLVVTGDYDKATVARSVPYAVIAEFDNSKIDLSKEKEPSAFKRALEWAQNNQEQE